LFIALSICKISFGGEEVRSVLQSLVDGKAIPGAVTIVATKDEILDYEAVGFADIEEKIPMQKDALFMIASQTKTMTAVAFMILVDEGKVSLDDPVSKYIPEFAELKVKNEDTSLTRPKTEILIHHLLSHSGGLNKQCPAVKRDDMMTLEARIKEYLKMPLVAEPNTKHIYSRPSLTTVGYLIEIISGKSYNEFMQERIFNPLEMKNTTFTPSLENQKRLPTAYRANSDKTDFEIQKLSHSRPLENPARQPVPSGSIFSDAMDLTNFCQMLAGKGVYKGKRILSEKSVELMGVKFTPDAHTYGLGCQLEGDTFGHGGSLGTRMYIFKDKDLIAIYLIQCVRDNLPNGGNQGEKLFKKAAIKIYDEYKNSKE